MNRDDSLESISIHGHRGSRGTHPENTMASFREALDAGARFIELDVHLSQDGQPVVFHDPEISGKLCRDASGQVVRTPVGLRELAVDEIQKYDCGSLTLPAFPEQKPVPGAKIPTLEEVLIWKLQEAPALGLNIEIKREATRPELLPSPEELARRVISLLEKHGLISGSLVQSFDHDVVRAARKMSPGLKLSCLFENAADFARIASDCRAQVAAPNYQLIGADQVEKCYALGIELLPWTVNEPQDWDRLLKMGVRAIITDYPRRLREHLITRSGH